MAWEKWESVHDERQIIDKVCGERSYERAGISHLRLRNWRFAAF